MQTNVDPRMDAGVIALERSELQEIRGGIAPFLMGMLGGAVIVFIDGTDEFIKGIKEGYAWARM